jgi:hypothetical protein
MAARETHAQRHRVGVAQLGHDRIYQRCAHRVHLHDLLTAQIP